MKKIISILLVCIMLAGVFTACGNDSGDNTVIVPDVTTAAENSDGEADAPATLGTAEAAAEGVIVNLDGDIDMNLDNCGDNLPYNIAANFGENASNTMMFSWHVKNAADTQVLQITEAYNVGFNSYKEYAPTVTLWSSKDNAGNIAYGERNICRVVVGDLQPDTEYMYRVGSADGGWSPSRYFKTAGGDSFTFTVISDPQSDLSSNAYAEAIKAVDAAGENDFLMICGDISELVGIEQHYLNFFERFAEVNTMPFVTIPGNHETLNYMNSASSYSEIIGEARAYNGHFYNPQNGPVFSTGFSGTVNDTEPGLNAVNSSYYFYYNRTLFIMVNTQQENSNLAKTAEWIEDILKYDRANSLSDMTVVTMHKGIYGNRYYGTTYTIHEIFYEVFEKYDVDLVMSGHDHSYSVTAPKDKGLTAEDETVGTRYSIVGSPGPKLYQPQIDSGWQWDYLFDLSGVSTGTNAIGVYSVITVDGLGLHCSAYDLNSEEIYSYFIPKKRSGGEVYTSEDKPIIAVKALSDRAELTVSGNLNNIAEFSVEASGQVIATIGRGESGCMILGLTPSSEKTVYIRTVYTDGRSSVEALKIATESCISLTDGGLSLTEAAAAICDEYTVYVNGEAVGTLLSEAVCKLSLDSGDFITVELIKDGNVVCADYTVG